VAEAIQAQFKEIGIDLKVRAMDYSGWLDAYYAKDFDLLMDFSWGPPYDPHTLLAGSFSTACNEEDDTISYGDSELDQLINEALASTDETQRQEIYNQIWQRIDDEAAVIPLVFPQRVYAVRSEVQGFRLGGTEYDIAYAVQEATMTAQ
jgi:ABC-type transport system substrate-binding protein